MLCCCLSRPISSTYFIRSASVSVIRALYLGFVSDFPNDAGQQASAAGGVVESRASSFALLAGYRRYLIPRMSAMEYRAGGLPRSHSAARRAPLGSVLLSIERSHFAFSLDGECSLLARVRTSPEPPSAGIDS